jgi:hypothetical protein
LGIEQQRVFTHWNYFLCIEEDISKLSRWIELSENNFECYSLELARLLMTTCAEVDVVAKLVCNNIDNDSKAAGILQYQKELVKAFPTIHRATVRVPRHGLELTPWTNWVNEKTPPLWWNANNKVKHQRSEHFHQATLKHLLNSVAALLLLLVLFYRNEISQLFPTSQLFIPQSFCVRIENQLIYMPNF